MDSFLSHIKKYIKLSREAEKDIRNYTVVERVSKNDFLLKQGNTCQKFYFIIEGTIRTFFYQKGKDITYWIYPNNSVFTSWSSYLTQKPSSEYIEAIEDSIICSITFEQWIILYEKHPILEQFGRLVMEETISLLDDFYRGYYFMSAKEKYELLISVFPDIIQRANLGHIASMLGISQETLSRLRSK